MPRSLVVGNGSILVCLDDRDRIKDFYYDYVGLENHITQDAVCRVGVWVDGEFSWIENQEWKLTIGYKKETLVGDILAINDRLGIRLEISDVVYNENNIFIRKVTAHNMSDQARTVKVFMNHQFRMYGVERQDTVYFDPSDNTIVHYKGRRIAVIGGKNGKKSFSDYNVGLSKIENKEGTWVDAEDGALEKNSIEHGTVDSTICFEDRVDAKGKFTFYNWICMGKVLHDAKVLHKSIIEKTPEHVIESTEDFWHAWVNKTDFTFYGLDKRVVEQFKRSLLIMRTHVDNTGGIIASGDSNMLQYGKDNYAYVWHRDGAFVAMALDKARYHEVSKKFYDFSVDTISTDGYFFHKYRCDRSLGSSWHSWVGPKGEHRLPIQEDETALMISALWHHYNYTKNLEYVENVYNSLIKKAANFMLGFRNEKSLPFPSFDLWEKEWGIHTFTSSTVYDALLSASRFAELLGKEKDQEEFAKGANEVKEAIIKYLFNEEKQFFYKSIDFDGDEILHDATIDTSSFYGIFRFGVMDIDDKKLDSAYKTLRERLVCKSHVCGVVRYEGDEYYKVSDEFPGNPWFVTTMWLAQYLIMKAKEEADMKEVKHWLDWAVDRALTSGIFSEQINPYDGYQLSASPLTWSHAEYVTTVIWYLEKLEELGVCKTYNSKEG